MYTTRKTRQTATVLLARCHDMLPYVTSPTWRHIQVDLTAYLTALSTMTAADLYTVQQYLDAVDSILV